MASARLPARRFIGILLLRPWIKAKGLQQRWAWWVWWNHLSAWSWDRRPYNWWWNQCHHCKATAPWCKTACHHWFLLQWNCIGPTICVQDQRVFKYIWILFSYLDIYEFFYNKEIDSFFGLFLVLLFTFRYVLKYNTMFPVVKLAVNLIAA